MNSKEALDKMKETHKIIKILSSTHGCNSWKSTMQGGVFLNIIKDTYEKLKDGCGWDYRGYGIHCGERKLVNYHRNLCPNCEEIKKIYDAIHAVRETGGKDGGN